MSSYCIATMNSNTVPALPPKLKHSNSFSSKTIECKSIPPLDPVCTAGTRVLENDDDKNAISSKEEDKDYSVPSSVCPEPSESQAVDCDIVSAVPPPLALTAFMNPLYFAFNENEDVPTSDKSSESVAKPKHSDTDSICFLEKNNLYPSLDGLCQKKLNVMECKEGNVYDLCVDDVVHGNFYSEARDDAYAKPVFDENLNVDVGVDAPKPPSRISSRIQGESGVDIFDLVTFESPLRETTLLSDRVELGSDVNSNVAVDDKVPPFDNIPFASEDEYDVPVIESLPPFYPPPPPPPIFIQLEEFDPENILPCPTRPPPDPPIASNISPTLPKKQPAVASTKVSKSLTPVRKAPEPPLSATKNSGMSPTFMRKPLDVSHVRRPLPAVPVGRQLRPESRRSSDSESSATETPNLIPVPVRSAPEPPLSPVGAPGNSGFSSALPPPPVPPKPVKALHPVEGGTATAKEEPCDYAAASKSCKTSDPTGIPPPLPKRTYNTHYKPSSCTILGCISKNCDQAGKESSKFYASQDALFDLRCSSADNITVRYAGYLYKTGSKRRDFERRWCELLNGRLDYYVDDTARTLRGSIAMKDITCVSIVPTEQAKLYSSCNLELLCFEVCTVYERGRRYLFGAKLPSERQLWMNLLAQTVAPTAVHSILNAYTFSHAGFLHMKEGASGQWHIAFLILHERKLTVCSIDEALPETLDLRKAVAVEYASTSNNQSCAAAYEQGQPLYVNMPQKFLYLQGEYQQHTEVWFQALHQMWVVPPNGHLEDQHLTQDNVPVVVDKCLNFVGTHGVSEQGIYRLSGTSSKVKKLLDVFHLNPWAVHLKCEDYTVHDVATALKRYVRNFPECVLTEKLFPSWKNASGIADREERLGAIKELLRQLPKVNYYTLKKLIAHLCIICENSGKNMMPVLNIAPIFGPTLLFQVNSPDDANYCQTNCGMDIVSDLINSYSWLFEVDPKELEKEKKIQQALKLIREAKIAKRPTGDILLGVYIYNKNWGKCLNVKLTPTTTAEELCRYAIVHANLKETVDKLAVYEIVCNEELERPLHYTEKPLAVTLRWADWSDKEAKGNHLCIKYNHIYYSVMPYLMARQPFSMFSELKYAEGRSKAFKKALFEFVGAKLTCHKDAKVTKPLGEWNIEDITWYAGAESKRSPPTKWAFTFIDRHSSFKRAKDNPYFGRTVCCNTEEEFHKWMAAMLLGEFPQGVVPQRRAPDLLTS